MMTKGLRAVVALPGILFVLMGLRWGVDPAGVAATLGMPMLEGAGRSTQIGDMAALFLTMGGLILAGVVTCKRRWFYPPILLLALAATFRILAWLFHGAPFAMDMIAPEVIIATLLAIAMPRICESE